MQLARCISQLKCANTIILSLWTFSLRKIIKIWQTKINHICCYMYKSCKQNANKQLQFTQWFEYVAMAFVPITKIILWIFKKKKKKKNSNLLKELRRYTIMHVIIEINVTSERTRVKWRARARERESWTCTVKPYNFGYRLSQPAKRARN